MKYWPENSNQKRKMQNEWYLFLNFPTVPSNGKWGEVGEEQPFSSSVSGEWEGKGKKVKAKYLRGINSHIKGLLPILKYIHLQYVNECISLIVIHQIYILSTNNILETLLGPWVIKMSKISLITYRAQTKRARYNRM